MWVYTDRYGMMIACRSLKKLAARMQFDLKKATKQYDHHGKLSGYELKEWDDRNECEGGVEHKIEKLTVIK